MKNELVKFKFHPACGLKLLFLLLVFFSLTACSAQFSEYKNSEKGFSVLLPGKPVETSESGAQPYISYTINTYLVEPKFGYAYCIYGIAVSKFTISVPRNVTFTWDNSTAYDNAKKSVLQYLSGKLLSEQDVDISGLPGREFVILTTKEAVGNTLLKQGDIRNRFSLQYMFMPKSLVVVNRIVRQENRLYHLMLIYPEKKNITKEKDTFLGSFKLDSVPKPQAPATAAPAPAAPAAPAPAPTPAPAVKPAAPKQADAPKAPAETVRPAMQVPKSKTIKQPKPEAETGEQWKPFLKSAEYSYEYDAKSLNAPAADIVSVWIRMTGKDKENPFESLLEIHCSQDQYRNIQPQFQFWEKVQPLSFQHSLSKILCDKDSRPISK